jgi:hypothetical protein
MGDTKREKPSKKSLRTEIFREFRDLLRVSAKIAAVWFLSTVATVLF